MLTRSPALTPTFTNIASESCGATGSVGLTELTGLCKLVRITLESFITPKNTWLKRPLYKFYSLDADSAIASLAEFQLKLARYTPLCALAPSLVPEYRASAGPRPQ